MIKTYVVTEEYINSNENPIELKSGDYVKVGEKSDESGPWANWIYCTSNSTGKSGWTPVQILKIQGESAIAITDYTAMEMTVVVGDIVESDHELNGWLWCTRKSDRQSGWVPRSVLIRK